MFHPSGEIEGRACHSAERVIAVSGVLKEEVSSHYQVHGAKIEVIYNGTGLESLTCFAVKKLQKVGEATKAFMLMLLPRWNGKMSGLETPSVIRQESTTFELTFLFFVKR